MTYQIKGGKWVWVFIVIPLLICCLKNTLYWLWNHVCCAQVIYYYCMCYIITVCAIYYHMCFLSFGGLAQSCVANACA